MKKGMLFFLLLSLSLCGACNQTIPLNHYLQYSVVDNQGGYIVYYNDDGSIHDNLQKPLRLISVVDGEKAPKVEAVAQTGYKFASWSDGKNDPVRNDGLIFENLEISVSFEAI
jgi:hypothetical protein